MDQHRGFRGALLVSLLELCTGQSKEPPARTFGLAVE